MKKLMMAVATVVGLGLGVIHAEDIVDFDGNVTGAMSFMEAIKAVDVSQSDKNIKPVPEKAEHAFPNSTCALACFNGWVTDDCQCRFPVPCPQSSWLQNHCVSPSFGPQWPGRQWELTHFC